MVCCFGTMGVYQSVVQREVCVEVAMVRSYGYMHWYIRTWW